MVTNDDDGMGEKTQPGFSAAGDLDVYTALYRLVLVAYGHRCALTGARFAPAVMDLHPDLEVVSIKPRDQGGPLAIANYLPMLHSLVRPFRDGLITIEDDYRIVAPRPDLLDSVMLSGLRGSLVLPVDPLFRPDGTLLGHHRRYALGR